MADKLSPFDFLNAINTSKEDLLAYDFDGQLEKQYLAFMINRGLSQHVDCIYYANEMNKNHHLDRRLQFGFFINIIRRKKRLGKWAKRIDADNLTLVQEYYQLNYDKALEALNILTDAQIDELKKRTYTGGIRK